MPNWCSNYISIEATEELQNEIAEFVHSEKSDFDFEKIIPMPENIYRGNFGAEEEKLYGKNNWYDWSIEHWGTKWNAEIVDASPNSYALDTAWSPCEPVIAELARLFPAAKIVHRYEEPGWGFCGEDVYQNGTLVYKMQGDFTYDWTADDPDHCDEEELNDNKLDDELYPLQESGDLCATTEDGQIHIRKYKNGRLFVKIDGTYEDLRPEHERTYYW